MEVLLDGSGQGSRGDKLAQSNPQGLRRAAPNQTKLSATDPCDLRIVDQAASTHGISKTNQLLIQRLLKPFRRWVQAPIRGNFS